MAPIGSTLQVNTTKNGAMNDLALKDSSQGVAQSIREGSIKNGKTTTISNDSISINPPQAHFSDVSLGNAFTVSCMIRNVSSKSTVIRLISGPSLPCFSVLMLPDKALAPGLTIPLKITFYSEKESKQWTDRIILGCGTKRFEIPLIAEFPKCKWHYGINENEILSERADLIDLGVLAIGSSKKLPFIIQNRGSKSGLIEFTTKNKNGIINFNPSRISLSGHTQGETQIEVIAPSDQLGVVQGSAIIRFDDDTRKEITFSLSIMDTKLNLINPKTLESLVDGELVFSELYYGNKQSIDLLLVNNGPYEQTYSIGLRTKDADEDRDNDSDDEFGFGNYNGKAKPQFYAVPSNGKISAFQKIPIKFFFEPNESNYAMGFSSSTQSLGRRDSTASDASVRNSVQIREDLAIDVEETGQKLLFTLEGKAIVPNVVPSEKSLDFGSCPANDYCDILVTIVNNNILPIDFNFLRIAHFQVTPSKGTFKGMETKNIRFSFSPTQLGTFNSQITLSLLEGKYKIQFNVSGRADKLGEKKTIIGGTDKLPEDFERKPKWIKNSRFQPDALEESRKRFLQKREQDKEQQLRNTLPINELRELKKTKANKEHYNNYIKTQRETKSVQLQHLEVAFLDRFQNDLEYGMIPGGGLLEPIPSVTVKRAPVYISGKGSSGIQNPGSFEADKQIQHVFKPYPTTNEEKNDCAIKLTPKHISKLLYGPKSIDFGEMTVFATSKKSFAVRNTLNHHILVELATKSETLLIEPQSQVIPPMQTGGFQVIFSGRIPQTIQETIFFSVNSSQRIKFITMAELVPTRVSLSSQEIEFKFDDGSIDMHYTAPITIKNYGNSSAIFQFNNTDPNDSDSTFQIQPQSGELLPYAEIEAKVIFTPGNQNKATQNFLFQVKGAKEDILLKCMADLPESKVVSSEKKIEFGTVPVGIKREKYFTLKNTGKNGSVFRINSVHKDITISPSKGRIAANSSQKILIEMNPSIATKYDCALNVDIRGGRRIKVDLFADSQAPDVELLDLEEKIIDFGSVSVGTTSKYEFKVKNLGSTIPAILFMDLVDHSDFYVQDANGIRITMDTPESSKITVISTFIEEEEDSDDDEEESEKDDISITSEDNQKGEKYQIVVPPETVLSFFVVFAPRSVEKHKFPIPLEIAGIARAPFSNKEFVAIGEMPRLLLSQQSVNFRSRVIHKEGVSLMPHRMIINLTNEDTKDLQWSFDLDMLESHKNIFRIEPADGKLMRGHTIQVQVFFTPKELKQYDMELPVYLDGQINEQYTTLSVKGSGSNPKITFDVNEIVLPIVPLGVKSRAIFQVINEGYENLELRYKLPADTARVPIQLNFIEGRHLSTEKLSIPVEVLFETKKPMSFTANIDFYDMENNRFSIPVTCTADNCLLSNYPYLVQNKDSYIIHTTEDGSIQLISRDEAEENGFSNAVNDQLSTGYTASVYSSYTTTSSKLSANTRMLRKIISRRSTKRLLKWINLIVLSSPIDDLLKATVHSNGSILYDMIQFLSGKKAPGKASKLPNNKKEIVVALYEQYENLLNFLRSYGALLNMIRPHHFLQYEDYRQLLDHPKMKGEKKVGEQTFRYKSQIAWLTTIYQIIKLFYLNRITTKVFKSLPPFINDAEVNIPTSNLYSTPECVLLKWISVHYNIVHKEKAIKEHHNKGNDDDNVFYEEKFFQGFGKELSDSIALSAVLQSHIPSLSTHFSKLKTDLKNAADYEFNANLFIEALSISGIDYPLQASDILQGNSRDTLLFVMYLFLTLPQYVPKTTIVFSGNLQQVIEKTIELSNPSKFVIEYNVSIENMTNVDPDIASLRNDEFKISEKRVIIEPNATVKYKISSKPRFSTPPGVARITFNAKRNGPTKPATMVFLLQNNVKTDRFMKVFEVTTTVFETQRIELDIENPFDQTGLFKIQIQQWNDGNKKNHIFMPDPFWYTSDHINIKGRDKKKLPIFFLPFNTGIEFQAKLLFSDPKVGEFVYSIKGTATEPEASVQSLKILCEADSQETRDITLSAQNATVDRALQQLKERNRKYRFTSNDTTKIPEDALNHIKYKVFYSSRYFTGQNEVTLDKTKPNEKLILPVNFKPKAAGIYPCTIKLVSDLDFRVLNIEGTARSPGVNIELQFSVPARKLVMQDIPITNTTDQPWKISSTLKGEGFTGPKDLRVPAKTTVNYPLTFLPIRPGPVEGELVLQNPETLEKYIYTLNGEIEDPLAEDKIQLNCQAREEIEYTVNVPHLQVLQHTDKTKPIQSLKSITYTVEVDLPFVKCEKKLTVSDPTTPFKLNICPPMGGHHAGSITFSISNPDDPSIQEHVWFTIDIQAERPPPEQELVIQSIVRESSVAEITISNPLDRSITFEIIKEGKGLIGDDFLTLKANESLVYELMFSPLLESSEEGFISFYNESVGEFWYHLLLVAKPASPIRLTEMKSEIGKKSEQKLRIDNPLDSSISLNVECSNPRNFTVDHAPFHLNPYESIQIPIQYYPSSVGVPEVSTITFSHPVAGIWTYEAIGIGLKPTSMETSKVYAELGRTVSHIITFRNPFREKKTFSVRLDSDSDIFTILTKSSKRSTRNLGVYEFNLAPFSLLHVTLAFTPPVIGEFNANVIISTIDGSNLQWIYPIFGITEITNRASSFHFISKARSRVEKTISVTLEGLNIDSVSNINEFTHEINFDQGNNYQQAIKRSLILTPLEENLSPRPNTKASQKPSNYKLNFKVDFAPLRPFEGNATLRIQRNTGGIWSFDIQLTATSPEIDDVITIEAAMGKTSKISFRLNNVFARTTNYEAYFTPESPFDFSVEPEKGILAASGYEGTQFLVSYTASEYGKSREGILIIDTNEMQWRYAIHGVLPATIRVPQKSRIENQLSEVTQQALEKAQRKRTTNIIAKNINSTSQASRQKSRLLESQRQSTKQSKRF